MRVVALVVLLAYQTRPLLQAQTDATFKSQAFLDSKDTQWLQICDQTKVKHYFKKIRLAPGGDCFAALIAEEEEVELWQQKEGKWLRIDIDNGGAVFYVDIRGCILELPRLEIVDFNADGDMDLVIHRSTNMYGNIWSSVYLFDDKRKTLRKLKGLNDVPNLRFDPKTGIIWSQKSRGVYSTSWMAYYQLRGFRAYPLKKAEQDYTSANVGIEILRLYKGKGKKWKLKKKVEMNEADELDFLKEYESLHR